MVLVNTGLKVKARQHVRKTTNISISWNYWSQRCAPLSLQRMAFHNADLFRVMERTPSIALFAVRRLKTTCIRSAAISSGRLKYLRYRWTMTNKDKQYYRQQDAVTNNGKFSSFGICDWGLLVNSFIKALTKLYLQRRSRRNTLHENWTVTFNHWTPTIVLIYRKHVLMLLSLKLVALILQSIFFMK